MSKIHRYLPRNIPFGPTSLEQVEYAVKLSDKPVHEQPALINEIIQELHKEHFPNIDALLQSIPGILIGRRGCGKTSLAYVLAANLPGSHLIPINNWEVLEIVFEEIQKLMGGDGKVLTVSRAAQIWKFAIYATVMQYTRSKLIVERWEDDEGGMGRRKVRDTLPAVDAFLARIEVVNDATEAEALRIATAQYDNSSPMEVLFEAARIELFEFLRKRDPQHTVAVIIDQFDEHCSNLHKSSIRHAIGGLLEFVSLWNAEMSPVKVLCCIPAEYWHVFLECHGNAQRIAGGRHSIRWTADQLAQIAAFRYLGHVQEWAPNPFYANAIDEFKAIGNAGFLDSKLPESMNGEAQSETDILHARKPSHARDERPLDFILRHTMLNPRHLLLALNCIWSRLPRGKTEVESNRLVIEGVLDAVDQVVDGINQVYKASRPNVDVYTSIIVPRLPSTFSRSDFNMIYKGIERNLDAEEKTSADDALDTLVEIGAVGLVLEQKDGTAWGRFEYSIAGRLNVPLQGFLCLHPMFAAKYCEAPPKIIDQKGDRAGEQTGDFEREAVDRKIVVIPHPPCHRNA